MILTGMNNITTNDTQIYLGFLYTKIINEDERFKTHKEI